MKNIILAIATIFMVVTVTPANAGTYGESTAQQESVKQPKKKKVKGFNYGAHSKKNKKAGKRASQKFKGGDMTKYNCRR